MTFQTDLTITTEQTNAVPDAALEIESLTQDVEQPPQTDPSEDDTLPSADGIPGNVRALPDWAQGLIRRLRSEAGARRVEAKTAREALQRIEAERAEHQAQIDAAAGEIATLKPQAERMNVLDAYVRESVAARVAALPDAYKPLVPQYDDPLKMLVWLDANAAILNPPRAPMLDAGARGDSRNARISEAEHDIARRFGLTPEQYARAKKS